ncbi:MAG TPA: hypothetical protein VF143_05345 [Candidatus Nanopelagicales bacterium]
MTDDRRAGVPGRLRDVPGLLSTFGGEDPVAGAHPDVPDSGWYHELITRAGAVAAGWSAPAPGGAPGSGAVGSTAADAIAWHADYLDSYLYNPLWWFGPTTGGGLSRLGAALMARPALVTLHFDDLTSTAQIRTMWRRYLGGTVAALVWAAERDDVAGARNAIGTGLHAMQDFYSHSNWVDSADRRTKTWFEAGAGRPLVHELPWPDRQLPVPVRPGAGRPPRQPPPPRPPRPPRANRRPDPSVSRPPVQGLGWHLGPPQVVDTGMELGLRLPLVGSDPRPGWDLYTGMYEHGLQHGFKPHGKYAFDCTLFRALPAGLRDPAVAALSFIGMTDLAARWRQCTGDTAAPATPPALAGIPAPPGVLVLAPTGIALDNQWMAAISRPNRALDDPGIAATDLFATARGLATRTTTQWLEELARIAASTLEPINPGFWARVTTQPRSAVGTASTMAPNPESPADIAQYEDPARQPFQFLSAGQYPPDPAETADAWWLRVTLGTSSRPLSGTNADIVLRAGGVDFLLDHGRLRSPSGSWSENRLLEWDDFEAGSRTAYVVGPFAALPSEITLRNQAASAGAVLAAAWDGLVDTVAGIIEAVGDLLLTLVGGHADLVGDGRASWGWADLQRVAGQGFPDQGSILVDGGPEGRYRLSFDVWASPSGDDLYCQVHFRTLTCLKESDWDRGTTEDEPFVLALVTAPASGFLQSLILGPYSGVDTGEFRTTSSVPPVLTTVARGSGLIVAIQVFESDDESPSARQQLLAAFAGRVASDGANERSAFLDTLGTTLAPDWRIGDVEVFAFRRNAVVEAGTVLPRTAVEAWLEAGRERTFPFTQPPRHAIALGVS